MKSGELFNDGNKRNGRQNPVNYRKSVEVGRTATNSNKLEHPKKREIKCKNPYEIRGMVEVDRTRTNFDTKFPGGLLIVELKRTKSPRAYAARLAGERRWNSNLIEVGRTATNSNKLEHPKKREIKCKNPYEIRGMVEVDRTRTNFDTKFLGRGIPAELKRDFLNRREIVGAGNEVNKVKRIAHGMDPVRPVWATPSKCLVLYSFVPFVNFCSKSFILLS